MTYIGCKVKIDTNSMGGRPLVRLHQILYRDSRIIRDYINIIKENEKSLFNTKKNGDFIEKIIDAKLDKITATTDTRFYVKHDLKLKYPRISLNELKECRDTARAMYNSYLSLKKNGSNYPTINRLVPRSIGYRRFKLDADRMVLSIMDSMDTNPKMVMDGKTRTLHNDLDISIILSNYHLSKLNEGELKAVKIFYDKKQMTIALSIKVGIDQLPKKLTTKPIGVLGIDLGINIAASTVLINHKGRMASRKLFRVSNMDNNYGRLENTISNLMRVKEVRMIEKLMKNFEYKIIQYNKITQFNPKKNIKSLTSLSNELKIISLNNLDTVVNKSEVLINDLQAIKGNLWIEIDRLKLKNNPSKNDKTKLPLLRKDLKLIVNILKSLNLLKLIKSNYDKKTDGVLRKLRKLRNKREFLKLEIDRQLINQMIIYIQSLTKQYDLYISLGKLKGIRNRVRRGNGNKAHRKRIHRWAFARFTSMLEHKLSLLGLQKRFLCTNEAWTSKNCHKCNTKGERPKQSYFICSDAKCGWNGNADINGAINIAKKLIAKFKLTQSISLLNGKNGLGKYLPTKAKSTPKARKRSPSRKTTGTRPLTQWFQDDLPDSAETPLPGVEHTNRKAKNFQHPKQILKSKKLESKVMATSGWDGKNA